MRYPPHVTLQDVPDAAALSERIRRLAHELDSASEHIVSCRVRVAPGAPGAVPPRRWDARIDLTVPGREIVVEPERYLAHDDAAAAAREAFRVARLLVEDHERGAREERPAAREDAACVPYARWEEELRQFSLRNAGATVDAEVHRAGPRPRPETIHGLRLEGVDLRTDEEPVVRLELFAEGADRYVRRIGGPVRIERSRTPAGTDAWLEIRDAQGDRTVLRVRPRDTPPGDAC